MIRVVITLMLSLLSVAAMAGVQGLHLECKITVPQAYQSKAHSPHFRGTSPFARYSRAYEAFWWNCVAVRAADIRARCPFVASGWPSEAAGANDGATDAIRAINRLVKEYGAARVQAYLEKFASPPSKIRAKLHGYFFGKPRAAPVPSSSD